MVTAPLEQRLAELLAGGERTIATAESCTGGLVSHRITSISGSSAYFLGGVVAYSNGLKQGLLDVPAEVLRQHGAVSRECALAMARGIRSRAGATIGVSTTGIAGPGGATRNKPVGLVYVACVTDKGENCRELRLNGDRLSNIRESADVAFEMLLDALEP
jgi:PncC family amidohydrolase